ncbi:coiled-coil domain-containing protein 90B, mitochondrial [Orycteropus afer afer]|uniref:Coiled-coil domain-containing protein 90B, mitochondrial n=1 Tax=Orycteropus afer afer TaxID=1230840 RepID=A0A8B7A926_ORYAF|nr:coiled-coil domain-containing protein 90B, mitochondrial [Orycteropus afer afer]
MSYSTARFQGDRSKGEESEQEMYKEKRTVEILEPLVFLQENLNHLTTTNDYWEFIFPPIDEVKIEYKFGTSVLSYGHLSQRYKGGFVYIATADQSGSIPGGANQSHFPGNLQLETGNYISQHPWCDGTIFPNSLSVSQRDFRFCPRKTKDVMNRWALRCLRCEGYQGYWASVPRRRFSPALRRDFLTTTTKEGYDVRQVDITPLEQRKLTFDTHALVQDLETHGFDKAQAETIVSALSSLSNVSLDTIYKEMVTQAQQEITVQQLMAHLDSIRKDMVILEKSEFANLRAENEKMKIELDQVKQQLINETSRIRADNKLDINLERSRVTDMFTDQEKKLMEVTTEFTKKDNQTKSVISETSNKIDSEIASLKTLMESNKLETIRYLAASVFTCLAIALGFYRFWK